MRELLKGEVMELHVGRGASAGALTVFPIWNGDGGRRRYSTDVARLAVGELEGGPSVPGLNAVNQGAKPVLVLEGHLFEGGWQDRMAMKSVILAPGRAEVVEVVCVEQRRWGGATRQVTRGRRATPFVRGASQAPPSACSAQSAAWRRVDTYRANDHINDTGSLVGHLERADSDVRRLTRRLRPLPGQAGVIVAIAGQPLMMEVFDDAETLREQFDSIIAAAGLDALGRPSVVTPSRRARRLVERLAQMDLRPAELVEHGVRLHGRDPYLDVGVLSWRGRPVHLRATFLRHPSLAGIR